MKKEINYYKNELADSYEQNIDREIDAAIAEAEANPHVFSKRFEKSMREMIRTGKPDKLWAEDFSDSGIKKKKLSKRGLRVLLIAAAVIVALTAVACAVPEIRESIAGFFVQIFGDHVEYSNPDITKESIEEEYGLVPMPEGFSVENVSSAKNYYEITYSNDNQTYIKLIQAAKGYKAEYVDNNQGSFSEISVGAKTVRLLYSDEFVQASWIQDGYYFSLTYMSSIDLTDFEALIELVNTK